MSFTVSPCGRCRGTWMLPLLAAAALFAVPGHGSTGGLTLEAALREASLHNAELAAERALVRAAEGRLDQAGLWPNPRIGLTDGSDQLFGNEGEYTRSIDVSQDFPIGGRIAKQRDLARVDVALAVAELADAERKLSGGVADAFYTVISLNQQTALQDRLIAINEPFVSLTRTGFKAGEISEFDVNTSAVELERLRQERARTAAARTAKLAELAALLGRPVGELPEIMTDTLTRLPLAPLPNLMSQATAQRPDLRIRQLEADRASAERALSHASAWEDWTVSLGVQQDKLSIVGAPPQRADKALMLSLAVPVPLFNRQLGAQAAAVASQEAALQRAVALKLNIEQEIAGRYAQATQLAVALASYETATLPLAQKNAALARRAYQQGQLSISDVVQAQRQELDLNTRYLETLGEYYRTRVALDTAVNTWAAPMARGVDSPNAPTNPTGEQ